MTPSPGREVDDRERSNTYPAERVESQRSVIV